MNKIQIVILFVVLGSIAWIMALYWSELENQKLAKQEIEELATDANFLIGDMPIITPFVTVLNQRSMGVSFTLNREKARTDWKRARDDFRLAASSASYPLVLEKIELRVRALGWSEVSGEYGALLCERLRRKWARSICFDVSAPLLQSLPYNQRIILADNRRLENWASRRHFSGHNGTLWNRLKSIDWQPEFISVICEDKVKGTSRSCTAAVLIDQHLTAIWSVSDNKLENAEQMAKRQGEAILAWVKYGLGKTESFEELQALAIRSKKPSKKQIKE